MSASLVGSEMCIRDSFATESPTRGARPGGAGAGSSSGPGLRSTSGRASKTPSLTRPRACARRRSGR
eukprot:4047899-Alexandrium_andersonii.AAC.1